MEDRFLSKVNKTDTCWLWTGGSIYKGYGLFWKNNNNRFAHRVSYELYNGPIPDGLLIRHKCDTPLCVNPEHLELGTQKDNINDMIDRGRRKGNIKLNSEQIIEIRRLLTLGIKQRDIARQIGVSQGTITKINQNKRWSHIT